MQSDRCLFKDVNGAIVDFSDKLKNMRQSTGIKDKNGVYIFEGDKARVEINYTDIDGAKIHEVLTGVIEWESKGAYYNCICDDFVVPVGVRGQEIEVINNGE